MTVSNIVLAQAAEAATNINPGLAAIGYGLGAMDFSSGRFSHATLEAVGHLGVLPGYRTLLAVFPANALSVAILTPSTVDTAPYLRWLVAAGQLTGAHT